MTSSGPCLALTSPVWPSERRQVDTAPPPLPETKFIPARMLDSAPACLHGATRPRDTHPSAFPWSTAMSSTAQRTVSLHYMLVGYKAWRGVGCHFAVTHRWFFPLPAGQSRRNGRFGPLLKTKGCCLRLCDRKPRQSRWCWRCASPLRGAAAACASERSVESVKLSMLSSASHERRLHASHSTRRYVHIHRRTISSASR